MYEDRFDTNEDWLVRLAGLSTFSAMLSSLCVKPVFVSVKGLFVRVNAVFV
jgi:hypothetical protein